MPAPAVPANDANLPFEFDLLYDIKTVGELHAHLTGARRTATSATDRELVAAMLENNIPMPEGYSPPAPGLQARYAEAMALLSLIHEHASPDEKGARGTMDSSWVEAQTKDLLDRHKAWPSAPRGG